MMVCRRVGKLTHMVQRGLLVTGLACSAHAQRDQPQPVTLQQAVAEAVDKNLSVLAEEYSVPVAQARIITARLRPNPILSIEGDHLNLLPPRYNSENMAGPPEYSIRTDFVFERGAKRQRRIDVAEAAVSTAELQFLNTIRSVVLDVQSAYVELLQAKADLALAEKRWRCSTRLFRSTPAACGAATWPKWNSSARRWRSCSLKTRSRRPASESRPAAPDCRYCSGAHGPRGLPMPPANCAATIWSSRWMSCANAHSRSGPIISPCGAMPRDRRPSYGCSWRREKWITPSAPNTAASRASPAGETPSAFFFSSNLPVFNRNQGEIQRARQEEAQAEARIRAMQATIENEVETACLQYRTARESLHRVEGKMLAKATDVRQITERAYRRGAATFLDFLDAQKAYIDTVQLRNTAWADFAKSLYTIDAATGTSSRGSTGRESANPASTGSRAGVYANRLPPAAIRQPRRFGAEPGGSGQKRKPRDVSGRPPSTEPHTRGAGGHGSSARG